MARAPNRSPENKLQVVLSVLRGEVSTMDAARGAGVHDRTVRKWQQAVLEGGRDRLASDERRQSAPKQDLAAENEELKAALGEAHMQMRRWKNRAE